MSNPLFPSGLFLLTLLIALERYALVTVVHGVLTTFSTFNCCYITMTCILKVFFLDLEGCLRGSVPMLMGTFTTTCNSSSVASDALLWHAGAPTLTYTSQHIHTKYTYN